MGCGNSIRALARCVNSVCAALLAELSVSIWSNSEQLADLENRS